MKAALTDYLRKALHTLEMPIDGVKFGVKKHFNLFRRLRILAYRGYGHRRQAQLVGRVLEGKPLKKPSADDPWWKNARLTMRRFMTNEIPKVRVRATFEDETVEVLTDSEGYFDARFDSWGSSSDEGDSELWRPVVLELLDTYGQDAVTAGGEILTPPKDAEIGVISDIDDTIMQSSATDMWRMAKLTLLKNAHTRTTFPHIAAFYRALQEGARGAGPNPIFYVSSSAWNIYDLMEGFLEANGFPAGPILLRDLGLDSNKLLKSGHDHKLERIEEILDTYPRLPFVLVGDSGQRDPWLYREAVARRPNRIAAIYIREVSEKRRDEIEAVAGQLRDENVDMLLMENALVAARHAAENGLIAPEALTEMERSPSHETSEVPV